MSLSSIIGQPLAVELAQHWLAKKTTHPLLFYGPEGVGKRTLALELAKALNCTGTPGQEACGACVSCRKVTAGNHPDVRVVNLEYQAVEREEAVAKQQSLRIETILEERRRLLQSSVEGRWKVMVLDEAHRLTADAANVLLKILEEPPPQTALFLLTPFRDRLFATLISRCQPLRFKPLNDEEMNRCLGALAIPENDRNKLIELALGSPGRALHLGRTEQIQAAQEAETLWASLPGQEPAELLMNLETRGRAARPTRTEMEERIQSLLAPALRALHAGDPQAAAAIEKIQQALQRLRQNVQPGLVYDHLLIELSQERKSAPVQR